MSADLAAVTHDPPPEIVALGNDAMRSWRNNVLDHEAIGRTREAAERLATDMVLRASQPPAWKPGELF